MDRTSGGEISGILKVSTTNAQIWGENGENDVASRVFGVRRRTGYLEKLQTFPHLLVKVPSQSDTSFPLQDSIEVEPSRFYSSAVA